MKTVMDCGELVSIAVHLVWIAAFVVAVAVNALAIYDIVHTVKKNKEREKDLFYYLYVTFVPILLLFFDFMVAFIVVMLIKGCCI